MKLLEVEGGTCPSAPWLATPLNGAQQRMQTEVELRSWHFAVEGRTVAENIWEWKLNKIAEKIRITPFHTYETMWSILMRWVFFYRKLEYYTGTSTRRSQSYDVTAAIGVTRAVHQCASKRHKGIVSPAWAGRSASNSCPVLGRKSICLRVSNAVCVLPRLSVVYTLPWQPHMLARTCWPTDLPRHQHTSAIRKHPRADNPLSCVGLHYLFMVPEDVLSTV